VVSPLIPWTQPQESHPSQFVGVAKEWGVFVLLNGCCTPGGRRLLRSWFQRPLLNLDVINERLDAVVGLIQIEIKTRA